MVVGAMPFPGHALDVVKLWGLDARLDAALSFSSKNLSM